MSADNNPLEFSGIDFHFEAKIPSIIKVVGVGGGGGNAVTHMFNEGIHDVTYVLCNTDNKALTDSPVPNKLQMGEGLGAGNRPERGRQAALESIDEIKQLFNDGTKMAFITAGMGGGTGTGAAPIVAQCAHEQGVLTVGIVTIPFLFEGAMKIRQALDGVEEMKKHVDALLVISNEQLRRIYPELSLLNGFAKADDTLSVAAKSIAEIITMRGIMNLDFEDVKTILEDSGVALMSTGYGEGENRITKAFESAIHSPLLNDKNIYNSQRLLFYITFSSKNGDSDIEELSMEEMSEVHEFMAKFNTDDYIMKWGLGVDDTLGNKIKITLLASGFGLEDVPGYSNSAAERSKQQREEERRRREEDEERREFYYGRDDQKNTRPHRRLFIFQDEDLDNEDVISMVESSPTAERKSDDLKRIKNKSTAGTSAVEVQPADSGGAPPFTINF